MLNPQEEQHRTLAEKMQIWVFLAVVQCESLRYKLLGGLAIRRECYCVLRFVMESGARGRGFIVVW